MDNIKRFVDACKTAGLNHEHVAKTAKLDLADLKESQMPALREAFAKAKELAAQFNDTEPEVMDDFNPAFNTTQEAGKGGCEPETVEAVVAHAVRSGAVVEGLMTVGPTDGDMAKTRVAFRLLRSIAHDLGLRGLSMGMTNDLEIAVEEGSTLVRVGSAIFGSRSAA
jgi:uncharacterized pyridoxal phosphate-containing UPF0001 family protein